MADRRVYLNQAAGAYTVTVDPVPEGETFAATFDDHRRAFGYAAGLRMAKGWSVVDLTAGHVTSLLGLEGGVS